MINKLLSISTFFGKKVLQLGFLKENVFLNAIWVFIKFIAGSPAVNIYNVSKFNYNYPAIAASHLCCYFNFLFVEKQLSVTANGAKVDRLPQSEQSNNALLAAVKEKSKQAKMFNINDTK